MKELKIYKIVTLLVCILISILWGCFFFIEFNPGHDSWKYSTETLRDVQHGDWSGILMFFPLLVALIPYLILTLVNCFWVDLYKILKPICFIVSGLEIIGWGITVLTEIGGLNILNKVLFVSYQMLIMLIFVACFLVPFLLACQIKKCEQELLENKKAKDKIT